MNYVHKNKIAYACVLATSIINMDKCNMRT